MANPSYTYSLTNGTTADASQVMQDFNDILNGVTDGTKDLSISALTVAGTATLNGNVNVGNASGDDLTITASLASTVAIKTNNTYDIGSATLGLRKLYLGNGGAGATADIVSASHATTREYTIPDCSAAASFVMTQSAQTIAGQLTLSDALLGSAGSVSLPTYSFSGDPNTGMWGPGSDLLLFATNGTEAARFNATQQLGVGTGSSISAMLQAKGAGTTTGGTLRLEDSGTNTLMQMSVSGLCVFSHAGTETMRITAGGFVGVGTGSTISARLQMKGTGTSTAENFRCEDSATNTTFSVLDNGKLNGLITNWSSSATQDIGFSVTTGGGEFHKFTSSKRYKHDIKDVEFDTAKIYDLTARQFKWNSNKQDDFGFIAEEVEAICPELVIYACDAEGLILDDDKKPIPESVKYRQLTAVIIKEMQKLNNRLLALEKKLA